MEKNSVKQPVNNTPRGEKTSSEPDKCPICGKDAVKRGRVLACPEHGTEPWE